MGVHHDSMAQVSVVEEFCPHSNTKVLLFVMGAMGYVEMGAACVCDTLLVSALCLW